MFKKIKVNKNKINSKRIEGNELSLAEDILEEKSNDNVDSIYTQNTYSIGRDIISTNTSNIDVNKIKAEIDKKCRRINKGILIKQLDKEDIIYIPFKKEDTRESTVKKVFVSEIKLKEAKNPDEQKKLLGVKREELDRLKEEKKKGLTDMQKELFTLPKNLEAQSITKSDHVDNLLRLSTAGLIEVPLTLEQKLKDIEDSTKTEIKLNENNKKPLIDNLLAEELDFLKVLRKIGPSYAKGYKSDISNKKISKLNHVFENVFVPENSRKRKLYREKILNENRKLEENF